MIVLFSEENPVRADLLKKKKRKTKEKRKAGQWIV